MKGYSPKTVRTTPANDNGRISFENAVLQMVCVRRCHEGTGGTRVNENSVWWGDYSRKTVR